MADEMVQAPGVPQAPKAPELPPEPAAPQEPYRRSESIVKLAAALVLAQGEFTSAGKTSDNPFHKSKYADLAAVYAACRQALVKHQLTVMQPATCQGQRVAVTTLLVHVSGEFIESTLHMKAAQDTPQAIGSVITYARRYALSSLVGVAADDDDGNSGERTLPDGIRQDMGAKSALQQPVAQQGLKALSGEGTQERPAPSSRVVPARPVPSAPPPPPGMKPPARAPGS